MSAIWRAAHCVIYPSVYEGFGIPLVEAMEFEVPVAASSAGSLPEIGADAARYFDPDDPAGIALALEAIAHDQSLRRRLVSAGRERRNAFSFEAMTAGFLRCFETTLREGARARPAGP
jgi:glycosyltransferase involved in cell wall biosynthesis